MLIIITILILVLVKTKQSLFCFKVNVSIVSTKNAGRHIVKSIVDCYFFKLITRVLLLNTCTFNKYRRTPVRSIFKF